MLVWGQESGEFGAFDVRVTAMAIQRARWTGCRPCCRPGPKAGPAALFTRAVRA
ncbi:hypothetical protein [Nonomuraea jabiensis]|uniref:Uncharacterized protein n=1 Tax=Nonomuraea jabiensis TaxID=882448 RepID=A0A7W9G9R1_9ACTN|nr:hypothetical protein [Nonomuraea jabiensis]MBB5779808.1 hypothetical protein [Nonomuraea jabiensis]